MSGSGTGTPISDEVSPERYTANIPAGIKMAMLLLVGDLWKYRETIGPNTLTELPSYVTAERLLFRHTVPYFA